MSLAEKNEVICPLLLDLIILIYLQDTTTANYLSDTGLLT